MAHNPDLTKPLKGEAKRPYPGPASRRRMHGCPQKVMTPEEQDAAAARAPQIVAELIAEAKARRVEATRWMEEAKKA